MRETTASHWLQKELYRFFVDATDQELIDHGVTRDDVIYAARTLDGDDGTGSSAHLVWSAIKDCKHD